MKQSRNSIMRGMSGSLGEELVFRQRAGKTVASLPPLPREDKPTIDQVDIRNKFQEASQYARKAIADPALKAAYQAKAEPGVSAYNMAFGDFFKAPKITKVDTTTYAGVVGNTILIQAKDDFKVQSVKVSILNAAGDVLEEGQAVANPGGGDYWTYTATVANATPTGGVVNIQATDLPGNLTTAEAPI